MIQRCTNPTSSKFAVYGGSGITVCPRWLLFENFLEDMGDRPFGKTIDRINGAYGYYKENCKWSTHSEQQHNIKSNRMLTYGDETQCLSDWCKQLRLNITTVLGRLGRGWAAELALGTPTSMRNRIAGPALKLDFERAEQMRAERKEKNLTFTELGNLFGVSSGMAWRVCSGKSWMHP
jgi:hypothetical protein